MLDELTFSWVVNVTLLEQATGDSKTEVSTKTVNNQRTTNIGDFKLGQQNPCVQLLKS